MYILWKLVLLAVISTGRTRGSNLENIGDLNREEDSVRTFLASSDIVSESKFQCHNKPSGYYADPRFDCKVFHYCHEDGTKVTIPCIRDTEEHRICIFRDIAFNACEGSEIYLALPEDLQVKPSKETTTSAANSATDFKLPNVLPPPSSPENNHSTTPLSLSLNFERNEKSNSVFQSKESDSIFEVINSVLREIQTDADSDRIPSDSSQVLKLRPSTFSRGLKFEPSSIRRDDSSDTLLSRNSTDNGGTYLVEVYHKNNGKLLSDYNPYYKNSKSLFFLPKLENKTPAIYPRRRKRTVVEQVDGSRPFAVIYAKVPDTIEAINSNAGITEPNQRRDILEVPFVAARVPSDVPTIPVTIETRRKRKNKSKKKAKNILQTAVLQEALSQEPGNEQAAEQQNILFFTPGELGLQNGQGRENNRQRPQQSRQQPQRSNSENPRLQSALAQRGADALQIPNFPFQPTAFLNNPASPEYYFAAQDLQQPGNFPAFNLQDQFSFQPQQPQVQQPNPFQPSEAVQPQSLKIGSETRVPENSQIQNFRHIQNNQPQTVRQHESQHQQSARHPDITPQNIERPQRIPPHTFSQPEIIPFTFRQPNNNPQTLRQPENILIQAFREPENAQAQTIRQPENSQTQTVRVPGNEHSQAFRNSENNRPQSGRHPIRAHTIRQPEIIQPQTIGQLENIYLQNGPTLSLGQPEEGLHQTPRRPQSEEQKLSQNTPTNDQDNKKNNRERPQRPEESVASQRFPGFESPFFQNFPNFGPLNFNAPFSQLPPQSYDLLPPHAVRYQEQLNPNNPERTREQVLQQIARPQDQVIPHLILSDKPQDSITQPYANHQSSVHQPGPSVAYIQQPNQNPNLIEAERVKQQRSTPGPQILIAIPELPRSSRNRGRTTVVTESPTVQPSRQRNRAQSSQSAQRQNPRRPQGNNGFYELPVPESHQVSNYNRHSTEPPRSTSEIVYRPQYSPEVYVSEVPNDIRHRTPSTVSISDFIDNQRGAVYSQRQPTVHRDRDYHNNANGQSHPEYPTHQYTPTTPLPSQQLRQRTRRPEQHPSRETYQQGPRETNTESVTSQGDDRLLNNYRSSPSPYGRTRIRTSAAREQTELPVTNQYFVTSTPRVRQAEDSSNVRRPHQYSEGRPDKPRGRPQAQIERPPQEYANAQPIIEEYPRSQRHSSHRQQSSNTDNDVNIISTAEDPDIRHRTPSSGAERRPGYRGISNNRLRYNPEVERGFLPVTERPLRDHSYATGAPERDYSYATRAPEREYSYPPRTPERGYPYLTNPSPREYSTRAPVREYSYATRAPEREYSYSTRAPERDRSYATRAPEREYSYATRAPEREYSYSTRAPERERSYATRAPERERSYATRAPEKERSYATRAPERERSYATRAPEREYSYSTRAPERERSYATRAPERAYSYTTRAPEREYSYATRAPERERSYTTRAPERAYSYTTRAPEREYSYSTRAPEREHSYATRAPEREYSYATRTPESERDYKEPENNGRNKYQNNEEEIPTTRPPTTPRPTKKKRPPPPRPTFPPFPTFPPPPKRVTTTAPPKIESPESEAHEITEHVTEHPSTTQQTIRRQKPRVEVLPDISEPRYVTENYIQTDTPEVTTRRRSRKRRPKPRRPKTTTSYEDYEDTIQVESSTQATTHREIATQSTPSNFNRWRQQPSSQRKATTTAAPAPKSTTESEGKIEEYGSRINLFGRPRTRKPVAFTTRPTTVVTPSTSNDRRRITKPPTATRTRKPFVKKVRKRITTTTEDPETTESIARSGEDDDILHYNSDVNLQGLESVTQLVVENVDYYQTTTETYKDADDATTETFTVMYEDDLPVDSNDKSENFESKRSLSNKFQSKPRVLKFGKPRLRATDSPLVSN